MARHLVDIDEQALRAARAELGTDTIKATVNAALRRAAAERDARVAKAIDLLTEPSSRIAARPGVDPLARAGICDLEIGYSARSATE